MDMSRRLLWSRWLAAARARMLLCGLAALSLLGIGVCFASSARAGTIAVVSCKDPTTGAPEPIEGWRSYWSNNEALSYAGTVNNCETPGGGLEAYVADAVSQPGSLGPGWEYSVPAGDEIVGGNLQATMYRGVDSADSSYQGATGVVGPDYGFEGSNTIASDNWEPEAEGATYSLNGHGGGHIWTFAFCEPAGATCPADASGQWYWSDIRLAWADVEMSNDATPTGIDFSGAATGSGATSGTAELVFDAGDSGSGATGVYLVKATLGGETVYDATPNTNEGKCVSLGNYEGGAVEEFAYQQPCKTSESVTIPVDTASVKDGTHELVVTVIDAARNEAVVYAHSLTTDNAPVVDSTPTASGVASVGSALSGSNGSFTAPEGAGALSPISGQWLRCSDAAATHCSVITGATGLTYEPAASDVGYYLVYANTVSDSDGTTTSDSQPTTEVTAASDAPSCAGGECLHGGSGGSGSGSGSGGSSSGGSGGSSSGVGGSGSSPAITINLPGSSAPGNQTLLGSDAKWAITLRGTPTRVRKGTKVTLSGVVSTSPRPAAGKLIYLQAQSVTNTPRGKLYGGWITFEELRAKSDGAWKASYRFRLGGTHTYEMRAVAPREGGFANPTGVSSIVTIHER